MPSTYRIMALVKWAVLPLTVFAVFVVMYGQALEDPSKKLGPKVTDVVSIEPSSRLLTLMFTVVALERFVIDGFSPGRCRCGSTSSWARKNRNAWKSECSARPCRRRPKTSSSWRRSPKARGTKAASSTGSSGTS